MAEAQAEKLRLWEGKAPGALGAEAADVPTLSIYKPKKPDGSAIVVCPGGAYSHLGKHEQDEPARWLITLGITAFVLTYRFGPRYRHPAPFVDVSRAIRTVRHRSKEWGIDHDRVGVLGFSAGGHLAATVSNQFDADERVIPDEIDRETSRPDVSVLIYPVITMADTFAHAPSRKMLLGDNATLETLDSLSWERHVTVHTPPTFLAHATSDKTSPIENSLTYAAALRKAGVAFALHVFEQGHHGLGLSESDAELRAWPGLCATWLAGKKFGNV